MIINFSSYVKESVEDITISRSIWEMGDEFLTYYNIFEYLKKEMIGRTVNVSEYLKMPLRTWHARATIKVSEVVLDERKYEFHFIGRVSNGHEEDFLIPEKSTITWTRTINRNVNELDPYGEEDISE